MKISLTARLVGIMVFSILFSTLVTILLVGTLTVSRFRGLALQRDRNTAVTFARTLSMAASEGRLEQILHSMKHDESMQGRNAQGAGRMGMGRMGRMSAPSLRTDALPPPEPGMDRTIPIVVSDKHGAVLQGTFRDSSGRRLKSLSPEILELGAPFYRDGHVDGYVLAGEYTGPQEGPDGKPQHYPIISGVLISSLLSALLAMLLGSLLLRRALRPLKSLHKGVMTISEGEYSYRIETGSTTPGIQDDLTLLTEGFNEMAASLEASENWKRQIISDTAHELRTPVSLIMGNLEMIMDGVYEADRKRMEVLYRQSEQLAGLIRDLQTLAAEESRQVHTEERKFSLRELAELIAGDFSVLTERKGIALDLSLGGEALFRGDRNKTRQVLKNLLTNALKFTPPGGRVTIRQYADEEGLFLEVEDTGPGIPPEERERVFDRFYKLDKSRNSEGSGLGLAISRLLIANQGGRLEARKGAEGGALMRICFPAFPREKGK